jgi:short chain dehydrogenase
MTVVLITGALTGIGRATALAFAREGDQIVVSRRHGEAGEELAQELRAHGAEAEFICADVRHDNEMRKRFGRLEVAVNNAGTEGPPEEIADTIVFLACKAPFLTGQLSYCKTSPSDPAPNPRSEASARHSPSAASRTRGMAAGVVAPLPEAERVRAPRRAHARRGLLARHQTVRTSLKAGRTRIRMTGIVLIQHDADRRIKRRRQPMPGHKRGGYWIANFVLKRVTRFACDR